jgi:hypothetical protein
VAHRLKTHSYFLEPGSGLADLRGGASREDGEAFWGALERGWDFCKVCFGECDMKTLSLEVRHLGFGSAILFSIKI